MLKISAPVEFLPAIQANANMHSTPIRGKVTILVLMCPHIELPYSIFNYKTGDENHFKRNYKHIY